MRSNTAPVERTRTDMCPGVLRPWVADDGLLVRLRLIGGRVAATSLIRMLEVSDEFGNGQVYLTRRANLQIRGLPHRDGAQLTPEALIAITSTGLLPSTTHELIRNILVSPQTGIAGGRTDVTPVARSLDSALQADPDMAGLPGRFLFTLDDGRGDLLTKLTGGGRRGSDLGLVALSPDKVQLRIGAHWGEVVGVEEAALHLAGLASAFLDVRGAGTSAPWHLRELPAPLRTPKAPDPRLPAPTSPLPYGVVAGGTHVHIPEGLLTPAAARAITNLVHLDHAEVVVTPWHGIFVPTTREVTP